LPFLHCGKIAVRLPIEPLTDVILSHLFGLSWTEVRKAEPRKATRRSQKSRTISRLRKVGPVVIFSRRKAILKQG